jgi:hypothetical protein
MAQREKKLPVKEAREIIEEQIKNSKPKKPERVPVKMPPPPRADVTMLEYILLWLKSWIKNEAKREFEGTHSPLPFQLPSSPTAALVVLICLVAMGVALSC